MSLEGILHEEECQSFKEWLRGVKIVKEDQRTVKIREKAALLKD